MNKAKKSLPMPQAFTASTKPLRGANRVTYALDDAGLFPQAFTQAGTSPQTKETSKAVTARIDMSADVAGAGLCPECRKPMERSHANGIPVLTCDAHRIAIPIPDEVKSE